MTKFIEKPLRNKNKSSKKKLIPMFVLNLLIIGGMVYYVMVAMAGPDDKSLPNDTYPGALADEKDYTEKEPIPNIANVKKDKSDAYDDGGMIYKGSDLKVLEYGETENYKYNILLVGGSHSSHWLGALQTFAEKKDVKITHVCKASAQFSASQQPRKIEKWMENVNQYMSDNKEEIDLVFTSANISRNGDSQVPPGFKEQFNKVHELGIPIFAVRDNPRLNVNAVEEYEKDKNWTLDIKPIMGEQKWNPEKIPGVSYYDYTEYIAPNNQLKENRGNVLVYFDSSHLTDSFSRTLGPVIEKDVMKELQEN